MSFDLHAWADTVRSDLDAFLAPAFLDAAPESFVAPLRYPVFTGGKRFRPLMTLAAFEGAGGTERSAAMPAAAAVELIHTYSLVHDDLPAMDDDDERRGRPTVHVAFDEATAILVGDALLTEAFGLLAAAPLSAAQRVDLVAMLVEASGYRGMVGGQAADIGWTRDGGESTVAALQAIHTGKTGALIRAATLGGAISAGADAPTRTLLADYGAKVGLAFQLADDVLDADEDEGDDGPPSYVKLLGIDETLRRARALADEAVAMVAHLPNPDALVALARYTVDRDV